MNQNIQDVWRKLDSSTLTKPVEGYMKPPGSSIHTLAKLKRTYYYKLVISLIFLIGFILIFVAFSHIYLRIGLAVVVVGYALLLRSTIGMIRNIKSELPADENLIETLRYTKTRLEADYNFEKKVALILYPFACASGFMVGFSTSGGSIEEIFTSPKLLLILAITIVVLTPLCYFFAKWMYKKSYGKCLADISSMLEDLESL